VESAKLYYSDKIPFEFFNFFFINKGYYILPISFFFLYLAFFVIPFLMVHP